MKIRSRKHPSGSVTWQLDLGRVGGKRVKILFKKKADAETHMANLKEQRRQHGAAALSMSQADRVRFAAADLKLAAAGISIEQAVEWALERSKAVMEKIVVPQLVERFVVSRKTANKRERYVRQLRVSLGGFAAMYPETLAADVTRENVKAWLTGNGWAPKTQENYLGDLRACFAWARDERLMNQDPCAGIETPEVEETEVQILTPTQCEHLLLTALNHVGKIWDRQTRTFSRGFVFRPLLGYAVLAMVIGVRPEEVKRSPRRMIHLDEKTFVVSGAASKTRQRRTVELPKNAIAWLKLWMKLCPDQEMIIPKNFRKLWEQLREAAGLKPPGWSALRAKKVRVDPAAPIPPWVNDVLRHTAATMHYARYRNLALLQAMLGHWKDEDTLFRHYRAVEMPDGKPVTKDIALKFYAIVPPAVIAVLGDEDGDAERAASLMA